MSRLLSLLGILITLVYLGFAYWLIGDRLFQLQTMELNAVGDFFAGIFGPLAILWLVLGFFQQGIELRLQVKELNSSVAQQKELVSVTRDQLSSEMEVIREARDERRRSLMPQIKIDTQVTEMFADSVGFNITLRNIGHSAEDLVFYIFVSDNQAVMKRAVALTPNETLSAKFSWDGSSSEVNAVMCYTDGLQERHVLRFSVDFIMLGGERPIMKLTSTDHEISK